MALKGTLKDFGISDIFQLIQQQQKAGILVMRDKDHEVRILFDTGKIVGADSAGPKQQKEPLGVLLVRAGLVTQAQLDAALGSQQKNLRKLGDLLIADNAISKETLKGFLALQTTETINRLFRWKQGEYEFIPQPVKYDADVATPLSPEHLLMDGFRMLDEWPAVLKKIRGLDAIYAVPKGVAFFVVKKARPKPGAEEEEEEDDDDDDDMGLDDAFDALEGGGSKQEKAQEKKKIKLSGAETVVYELLDGIRTVQDVIDRSLLGEFNTCNALAGLIDKNTAQLLGRKEIADEGRIPVVERPRGEGVQKTVAVISAIAILLFSLLAAVVLGPAREALSTSRVRAVPESGSATDAVVANRTARANNAAWLFFLANGRWPKDVAELSRSGILGADETELPGGDALVVLPPEKGTATGRVARIGL